jgi:hypothetical protein
VNNKIIFSALSVFLSIILFLPSLAQGEMKVYVNGTQVSTPTISQNDEVYVSVSGQSLAQALKISVKWDSKTQTLTINGKSLEGAKPLVKSGTVYVPVMALANHIGADVEFDYNQNIIKITTGKSVAAGTPKPNPTKEPTPPPPTAKPTKGPTPVANNSTPPPTPKTTIFVPKTAQNDNFSVTITNLEYSNMIKNYYTPKSGNRFCTLNISQQNISSNVQVYTGTFSLIDKDGHNYDYLEGLSNFWLQVLQPGGTNFGHLVYEIPSDAVPDKLVLYSIDQPSLTIPLN